MAGICIAEESEEEAIEDSSASLKPAEPTRNWWQPNPSEPPLASQSHSSVGWRDSYFPVVESPLREGQGSSLGVEPKTGDSMAGVGAHNCHRPSNGGNNRT